MRVVEQFTLIQGTLHLRKVKSHIGIVGNEIVDDKAKEATESGTVYLRDVDNAINFQVGQHMMYLPTCERLWLEGGAKVTNIRTRVHRTIQQEIKERRRGMQGNEDFNYTRVLHDRAIVDLKKSNNFWKNWMETDGNISTLIKARENKLWTNAVLHKMDNQRYPSKLCPLCREDATHIYAPIETGNHLMLMCKHPKMHALIVGRHDKACGKIFSELKKSKLKGNFAFLSAGKREGLSLHDKMSLPNWVIEKRFLQGISHVPDIVVVQGIEKTKDRYDTVFPSGFKKYCRLNIIEVQYTNYWNFLNAEKHKIAKYKPLIDALVNHGGWTRKNIKLTVVPFEVRGYWLKPLVAKLERIGFGKRQSQDIIKEGQRIAREFLRKLYFKRNQLVHGRR
tara:strand:+ start:143 stop:1321 length:1179 start_codon:yes stop_codon:yes gene_type:complete